MKCQNLFSEKKKKKKKKNTRMHSRSRNRKFPRLLLMLLIACLTDGRMDGPTDLLSHILTVWKGNVASLVKFRPVI